MKKISVWVVLVFVFILAHCDSKNENAKRSEADNYRTAANTEKICSEKTARIIGRIYYLSNPLEIFNRFADLEAYVNRNRNLLLPGSKMIQCMRSAGNTLIARGVQAYSQQDADRAYGRALEMGATGDMANKIRSNMNQGATELFTMGQELIWLSQVLPQAAQGNWNDFINTGTDTRQAVIQSIRLVAPMLDPNLLGIVQQSFTQYAPYLEYQVAVLVFYSTN